MGRCGGDEEIRTLDLTDANRTLSQLSYAPTAGIITAARYYNTFYAFVKPFFRPRVSRAVSGKLCLANFTPLLYNYSNVR